MDSVLWPVVVGFLPFFLFLLLHGLRKRVCPECGSRLPAFQSPMTKTRRQWVDGGYLCHQCGEESDLAGERVAPGTGYDRKALLTQLSLLALAGSVAVALIAFLLQRTA